MLLKVVYDSKSEELMSSLEKLCKGSKNIKFESYSEDYYKELKKARLIKASCGTKITPFIAIYDDSKEDKPLIGAFYGENNTNNLNEVSTWITTNFWKY